MGEDLALHSPGQVRARLWRSHVKLGKSSFLVQGILAASVEAAP